MKELINKLKGDKGIWSFVALLALFSFMPVFSASSNLAYMNHGTGNTLGYLIKHLAHICLGFAIMYYVQKVPYHYFKNMSLVLLPMSWMFLLVAIFFGVEQGSAARWVKIPFTGVTFQPSAVAFISTMIFVIRLEILAVFWAGHLHYEYGLTELERLLQEMLRTKCHGSADA